MYCDDDLKVCCSFLHLFSETCKHSGDGWRFRARTCENRSVTQHEL